ncbi:hypothetical protein BZA05DRAFT_203006 [Tricharina praecox]|uniref:uncharacterized protein n=1 Tax=Tricharina praecox TaxID=43433 RepID=UPI00221ED6E8|nr:uncharacterized protein BZA05DRAFT_203006 [Tricharina praecox]KAI5856502.1 hypothetical protein BZA05DRAFT_203006 [Tricharina praecox]
MRTYLDSPRAAGLTPTLLAGWLAGGSDGGVGRRRAAATRQRVGRWTRSPRLPRPTSRRRKTKNEGRRRLFFHARSDEYSSLWLSEAIQIRRLARSGRQMFSNRFFLLSAPHHHHHHHHHHLHHLHQIPPEHPPPGALLPMNGRMVDGGGWKVGGCVMRRSRITTPSYLPREPEDRHSRVPYIIDS